LKKNIFLFGFTLLLSLRGGAAAPPAVLVPVSADHGWTTLQITPHFWAEGVCAGDVDHDGHRDIICGPYWYAGPNFQQRHPIYPDTDSFVVATPGNASRTIPGFEGLLSGKNGYSNNFLSFASDLNHDGWIDYVVIGYPGKECLWFENPRGVDQPWARHVILDATDNESPTLVDLDGDGEPELLCMSNQELGYAKMDPQKPTEKWSWHPISAAAKRFQRYTHGLGYGDINGDGRMDIIEGEGWWEQPPASKSPGLWSYHPANFGHGAQMFGYDVNGDGRTDVITSLNAHGYGLCWFEQGASGDAAGWIKHIITGATAAEGETGVIFSQIHALALVDVNGDGLKDIVTGKRFWAHGPAIDPEPNAPAVLYWFELRRNGGQATFIPHLVHDRSGVGTQVLATDLNGDGKIDIVAGNKQGLFVHLRN